MRVYLNFAISGIIASLLFTSNGKAAVDIYYPWTMEELKEAYSEEWGFHAHTELHRIRVPLLMLKARSLIPEFQALQVQDVLSMGAVHDIIKSQYTPLLMSLRGQRLLPTDSRREQIDQMNESEERLELRVIARRGLDLPERRHELRLIQLLELMADVADRTMNEISELEFNGVESFADFYNRYPNNYTVSRMRLLADDLGFSFEQVLKWTASIEQFYNAVIPLRIRNPVVLKKSQYSTWGYRRLANHFWKSALNAQTVIPPTQNRSLSFGLCKIKPLK